MIILYQTFIFLVSRLKQENHQEAAAHEDTGNEDNSCVHDSPKSI